MASTQYLNMIEPQNLVVYYDFKPWGGTVASTTTPIPDARVSKVTLNMGSTFDTAEIILPKSNFGETIGYFVPIKIVYIEPITSVAKVIFRGFINSDTQTISSSQNRVVVRLVGYRWYISKVTRLRGRWYRNDSAASTGLISGIPTTIPTSLGSGLSAGAQKFVYEKFRAGIQDFAGYLQNEQLVFNRDAKPDCYIDNSISSTLPLFYIDDIDYNEFDGLPDDIFEARTVQGYYWTYATILRHIERFWIEPYNAFFAGLEIHAGDLAVVSNIPDEIARPMNFSLQNQNPLAALDQVVRSMPGKWMWYMDYDNAVNRVKVRIKEMFNTFTTGVVNLTLGDNSTDACEKLVDSDANVSSVTVNHNVNPAIKNVIARGGKIKVITTIKLVPLWNRTVTTSAAIGTPSTTIQEFADLNDMNTYKNFLDNRLDHGDNPLKFQNDASKQQALEYLRKFRYFGIPIEGATWANSIVNSTITSATGLVSTDLILTGDIANHYSSLDTNLKNMMFNGVRIDREIAPPDFNRFAEDIVVFLHDGKRDGQIRFTQSQIANREPRTRTGAAGIATFAPEIPTNNMWLIPEDEKINYKIDEENGIVIFEQPQVKSSFSVDKDGNKTAMSVSQEIGAALQAGLVDTVFPRDVYMTATFTLDVAAIVSKRIGLFGATGVSVIDTLGGPNFSEYIDQEEADIVVHNSAFYPLKADQKDIEEPVFSTDTLDGHELGTKVRPAQSFDNYRFYQSLDALQLMTSINSFLEGHTDLEETVSATLPYLETGYNLGDELKEIVNSDYTDLKSFLNSITYTSVGESDVFNTAFKFGNAYRSEKNKSTISSKNRNRSGRGNKRRILEHDNLATNVLV